MSYYIHQIPGRLRIKSPAVRRNQAAAETVSVLLTALAGVRSVAINTVTGSIIVCYDPKTISSETIVGPLKRNGYFDASKAMTHDQVIQRAASKAGLFLSRTFFGAVVETAFQGSAWSFLAILI